MPVSAKKKTFKRREHSILRWGGNPIELPSGNEPSDELMDERRAYLQTLLPLYLRDGYVKPVKEPKVAREIQKKWLTDGCRKERTRKQAEYDMYTSAKCRAKGKGLPFNLDLSDVSMPDVCPVFGMELVWQGKPSKNSPTLDRFVPELGYVKGNVAVISMQANRMKSDANAEDVFKLYSWIVEQGK